MSQPPEGILKAPAKVLGCLRPGYLTVFVGHGIGMANGGMPVDVPMDRVPFNLRMPNSEVTVVIDRTNERFIGVERQGSDGNDQGGLAGAGGK
jgi:hypothetical protein